MHFKRNLWLSITGAAIIIIAVLFGSQQNEPNSNKPNSLPQFSHLKAQQESIHAKESYPHGSYINH